MLIVSWNVAGWEPTLRYVNSHYGSLEAYLDRHRIDILCVQEVKIGKEKLTNAPAVVGAHLSGWESFWSFSTAKRGFNGVTTFARKGLTRAADAAPLGDAALDAEGRCVMTEHANFVIFNVYVHTGGDDEKVALKLRFLAALERRMAAERAKGKRVVLCGDLNIASRGLDVPWRQVRLPRAALRLEAEDEAGFNDLAMAAFRTCLGPDGRRALAAALDGKFSSNTDSVSWHAFETALTESGVELGAESEKTNLLRNLSYAAGVSCSQADCLAWLRGVLEGGLVDPFAELRPTARGRFTCWNQQQNQRFNNCGRRIDYTLVDREVFERWVEAGGPLVGGDSEADALAAATAGGRWLPAPMSGGGGLQEAPMPVHNTQFVEPHTGFLYTPPVASDHVAVSLLLREEARGERQVLASDEATRVCSFRPQVGLKSFFAPKKEEGGTSAEGASSSKKARVD